MIDISQLTRDQVFLLQAQYEEGIKHLKYFEDTMKFFKFPEKRLKTFDTVYYEKHLPEIKEALVKLGKL